ncbi:hypothetical protein [Lacticaseibacillus paracasei]|uniref:hypothetical protein n=1 Tax=Lacticaseibacillus paracasei TaxID=1597 RepID=UPI0031F7015A
MNIKMMNQGIHFQDKNKYSLRYVKLLGILLAAFSLLIFAIVLWPRQTDNKQISLGQTFDQGNNQFQFAGVDTDKQNAAMYFYVTKNTIDPLAPLTTVVVTKKTHSGSDFHTQLKQIADDYYVVKLKKSAINNGRLFVKLGSKKDLSGVTSAIDFVLLDLRHPTKVTSLTEGIYLKNYLKILRSNTTNRIASLEKKLVQYNHDLQILKTSLARQKDTASLQVGKQKRATEQRMTQTETNIQDKKQNISDTQSAIKVAQSNLQSYEKRYQHYADH